ncbi:MAG: hypothetical protein HOV87_10480, partial [Catenulispora sp.]|nr:hypothetical protein [Catenulispora sp.]
ASHARDAGMDPARVPLTFFRKASGSISGPHEDIVRPGHVGLLDYEVEIGLVIGRTMPVGTQVTDENLSEYVAGLVITNDVSARDIQLPQTQFYEAKSYPTCTPTGPALVLLEPDELKRFSDLRLKLSVNGSVRQDMLAADMIYGPLAALRALTRFQHLDAGDLVLTGTPVGTALSAPPKPVELIGSLLPTALKWQLFSMRDLKFAQRWLVVDLATDADLGHWEGVHQVCDPGGAATFMRIGESRYRWEFQLRDGQIAQNYQQLDELRPLIGPWTRHVPDERLEIIRVAEYTFRAQIADRRRDRRIFLLGDAAHLTPPFIGQGMGAGLRDALNLSWKLAAVLTGSLPEHVLESYETERKPHARAMIRMAKLVSTAMTRGGRPGNVLRALIAPRLSHVLGINGLILSSRTPALHRSALVIKPRLGRTLAGSLCPGTLLNLSDGRFTPPGPVWQPRAAGLTAPAGEKPRRRSLRGRGRVRGRIWSGSRGAAGRTAGP